MQVADISERTWNTHRKMRKYSMQDFICRLCSHKGEKIFRENCNILFQFDLSSTVKNHAHFVSRIWVFFSRRVNLRPFTFTSILLVTRRRTEMEVNVWPLCHDSQSNKSQALNLWELRIQKSSVGELGNSTLEIGLTILSTLKY